MNVYSKQDIYSEQECAKYTASIAQFHDLLLQAWRTSDSLEEHVESISGKPISGRHDVFDAGCGTGQFLHTYKMLHPAAECYGMNFFSCQLCYCKDSELHLTQGDIRTDIPRSFDGYFDKVFCHYTLGHFVDGEVQDVVCRLARLLRPGGQLIMWDILQKNVSVDSLLGYRLRTSSQIHSMLNEAGLQSLGHYLKATLVDHLRCICDEETLKSLSCDTCPMLHIGTKPEAEDGCH